MSKGNPKIIIRVSPDTLAKIREAIDSNNVRRGAEPYDLSGWIRQAIEERLAKLERGRKGSGRKVKPAADQVETEPSPVEGVIHLEGAAEDGTVEPA